MVTDAGMLGFATLARMTGKLPARLRGKRFSRFLVFSRIYSGRVLGCRMRVLPDLRSILNSNNSSLFLMTKYANLARVDRREIILKFELQNVK